jgi:hypothetical protein
MKVRVLLPALAACLSACSSVDRLNRPIDGGSETNPLNAPGSNRLKQAGGPASFTPGQFVKAVMDNAAFFSKRPSGAADADKLLKVNTPMKVVQDDGTYVKVELEGGEVGYVPSVMVFDPNAPMAGLPGAPGDVQPLPPAPVSPLPTGGAGDAVPIIAPGEGPPIDAVPAVIDPTAPSTSGAVPPPPPAAVTPATPEQPTTPAEEKKEQP